MQPQDTNTSATHVTLYLVRHGETVDNAAHIMQGQRQGQLTPAGVGQIQELLPQLAACGATAVVCSDLQRSIDSARIIADGLHLPLWQTPLLRERDWGDFTGRYIPDLKGLPLPDNVESMEALLARADACLNAIRSRFPDQTIIAVGHGIINKAIQAVLFSVHTRKIPRMENAEVRRLTI